MKLIFYKVYRKKVTFLHYFSFHFFRSVRNTDDNIDAISQTDTHIWSHVFKTTVNLVRQLYTRDTRRQFCPDDHWINDRIILPLDRPNDISFRRSRLRQYRPFQGLRVFTREELGNLTKKREKSFALISCLFTILQWKRARHCLLKKCD